MLLAAAFLHSGGCVGGPNLPRVVQVTAGQRTTVKLVPFTGGQVFTLQNKSSGSAEKVYSKDNDPMTKVVTDEQLQKLLDVFAEKGAFGSGAQVPPDARDALVVQQGDQRWAFYRRLAGVQEQELAFHEAKTYFLSVWNGAIAYHTTDQDRVDLRAEGDRVRSQGQASKKKLQGIDRGPQ